LSLLLIIREVPDLNLGLENGYPDRVFVVFHISSRQLQYDRLVRRQVHASWFRLFAIALALLYTRERICSLLLVSSYLDNVRYFTRSPVLSCLSRRAQSGRRTSFGRRAWFIESHMVLVIFFLLVDLFMHFILDIKGVLLSS